MKKVYMMNDSRQTMGGGWSFMRNLGESLGRYSDKYRVTTNLEEADIAFISGATMVTRQSVDQVQNMGKKLVTRLDNVPRNSRNRNTGTSRLIEFANRADAVVWQCQWARDYYGELITEPKYQTIIYNGIDQDIFKPEGDKQDFPDAPKRFLYSRFNRDETKNWEVAWYEFQKYHKNKGDAQLIILGNFSQEQVQYNFDFFRGEKFIHIPPVQDPQSVARIMRACDELYAVYYNDCFSNTYLEALSCGLELRNVNLSGGTTEMLVLWNDKGREYFGLERMAKDYEKLFDDVCS